MSEVDKMMPVTTGLPAPRNAARHPTFFEAFRFWLKLGFISFGGPTGQIAIMHAELVDRKKWISEARFFHALNYCMLLPGPEAQQLAIYIGWLLHRTPGGLAAGALFVIPSIFILWGLSYLYAAYGAIPWVAAVFYGLKPAVMAIVAAAVIRIGQKALKNRVMWTLAALAFVAIFFLKVPFPVIILTAGLVGFIGGKFWREKFLVIGGPGPGQAEGAAASSVLEDHQLPPVHTRPSLARALKVTTASLLLWWTPVALLGLGRGSTDTLFREGLFFSQAAMVTFGGAYAVLPYVAQHAVEKFGWLGASQMMDGLGLAETTPGPLIMVVEFVGFMGGWNHPGGLPPLLAATAGALLTTWVTFVPCFLWVLLGAPHVEQLRGIVGPTTALSAVTAAVVGVILNLAVWFSLHALFPAGGGLDGFTLMVSALAFAGLARWKWDILPVVLGGGALGLIYKLLLAGV